MNDDAFAGRMFAGIAVFMAAIGTVYWFVSYEPAGTTMLALSAGLAALCGAYLSARHEPRDRGAGSAEAERRAQYLPKASPWPFVLGAGAWLTTNGLVVGFGYAIPGLVVVAVSVGGFVMGSRRRT